MANSRTRRRKAQLIDAALNSAMTPNRYEAYLTSETETFVPFRALLPVVTLELFVTYDGISAIFKEFIDKVTKNKPKKNTLTITNLDTGFQKQFPFTTDLSRLQASFYAAVRETQWGYFGGTRPSTCGYYHKLMNNVASLEVNAPVVYVNIDKQDEKYIIRTAKSLDRMLYQGAQAKFKNAPLTIAHDEVKTAMEQKQLTGPAQSAADVILITASESKPKKTRKPATPAQEVSITPVL